MKAEGVGDLEEGEVFAFAKRDYGNKTATIKLGRYLGHEQREPP